MTLNLKDLRDEINSQLVLSSQRASKAIATIEKTEKILQKADKQKQKILKKVKGEQQ